MACSAFIDNMSLNIQVDFNTNIHHAITEQLKKETGVKEFKIMSVDNKKYIALIRLENLDHQSSRKIFLDVLNEIEYAGWTYYEKKENDAGIHYSLLTCESETKGIVGEFHFVD